MPSPDLSPAPGDQGALAPWRQPWVTGTITGLAIAATAVISIGVFYLSIRDARRESLPWQGGPVPLPGNRLPRGRGILRLGPARR